MADSEQQDPLGRVLVLHDRTWFGHIIQGHPEVAGLRHLVEQAVREPTEIRHSLSDPLCRLYFGAGPRASVLIVVVGDIVQGVIKTAHLANKISGGPIEWSR